MGFKKALEQVLDCDKNGQNIASYANYVCSNFMHLLLIKIAIILIIN